MEATAESMEGMEVMAAMAAMSATVATAVTAVTAAAWVVTETQTKINLTYFMLILPT